MNNDSISRSWVEHNILSLVDPETRIYAKQRLDSAPPVDIADRPQGMNDILRSLIKWTEENKVIPEIYFMCVSGGIWLNLILRYHGKQIKHKFYVPGGVLCLNNWDMFPTEEEVNLFIEEAKAELLKKDGAERREADRWNFIHTEADLPKESDYYLVTSEVRQGRKYVCLAFYDASKGKFLKDASISVLGVIAWKPLPKPYESEAENDC